MGIKIDLYYMKFKLFNLEGFFWINGYFVIIKIKNNCCYIVRCGLGMVGNVMIFY